MLECEDLDQAIAIAAKIPVAERASVELRPVIEH
ncbi:MAG: YciI family protein [Gaiellaceae bacterium]